MHTCDGNYKYELLSYALQQTPKTVMIYVTTFHAQPTDN